MESNKAITAGTLTLAVSIISGWMWVTTHFMTRADADAVHLLNKRDLRETYLELKLDQSNTVMDFIEQDGVDASEQRDYELLKYSVQRYTDQLMELDK